MKLVTGWFQQWGMYLAIGAAVAAAGFGAVQTLRLAAKEAKHAEQREKWAEERLQASQDLVRQAKQADAAATAYEARIATARGQQRVIIREIDRVITASPDLYARQCIDADGLRAVAAAAAGTAPTVDPGRAAPAMP